jgi:hypothetical protein
MASPIVNVLATSFPGLNLPSTLSLPLLSTTSISELHSELFKRIPSINHRLILTTLSNKQLPTASSAPISDLLPHPQDAFLSVRLSVPVYGGKGGFGSQLRAAGGRMSSKRKKNQGENSGSSRNLDGRRLRTVTEAKALAEYLAIKPDMEKKEKEQRHKRWEQIMELAERREEEIKSGSKSKVDGKWAEDKDEAGERTREAVLAAVKSGNYKDNLLSMSSDSSSTFGTGKSESEDEDMNGASSKDTTPPLDVDGWKPKTRTFFGFDEEDEFMSEGDEDDDNDDNDYGSGEGEEEEDGNADEKSEQAPCPPPAVASSKGKGKLTAMSIWEK